MLHNISPDGSTIEYHCTNPECDYHNCANWESHVQCPHCDEFEHVVVPAADIIESLRKTAPYADFSGIKDAIITKVSTKNRKQGKTKQIQHDHPGIEWTGQDVIGLPVCECGTRMFLRVNFTDKEKNNPINGRMPIRHPENPNNITGFFINPAFERHELLAKKLQEIGKTYQPPVQEDTNGPSQ